MVRSKQLDRFKAGNLSARLGEVPTFNTYIKFVVEQPETMFLRGGISIPLGFQHWQVYLYSFPGSTQLF